MPTLSPLPFTLGPRPRRPPGRLHHLLTRPSARVLFRLLSCAAVLCPDRPPPCAPRDSTALAPRPGSSPARQRPAEQGSRGRRGLVSWAWAPGGNLQGPAASRPPPPQEQPLPGRGPGPPPTPSCTRCPTVAVCPPARRPLQLLRLSGLSFPTGAAAAGTRWEPQRPRPRLRPRGQPIGCRRQGGVSRPGPGLGTRGGAGLPAATRASRPRSRAGAGGRGAARAAGGAAGTGAGRRRRAWAGDAAAPRLGQRAAGAEAAAASALPCAASLGALARRTRRRRTGPRCPGAGGRSRGSENRASPSRDARRRRPEEGPGGACAGPGGAGRERRVWCGGSPGPGGRPLLGLAPSDRGLGDAGSASCRAGGRAQRAGASARPSLRPVYWGGVTGRGRSRDPGIPEAG